MRFAGQGRRRDRAASGMGLAIAKLFVAEGAKVVAADWHGDAVAAAAAEIGGSIVAVTADVSKQAEAEAIVDKAVAAFGRIDILVNNAGVMDLFQSVADVSNDTGGGCCRSISMPDVRHAQGGAADAGTGRRRDHQRLLGRRCRRRLGGRGLHRLQARPQRPHSEHGVPARQAGLRCNAIASGGVATNIMQSVDATKLDQAALGRLGAYHATNPGMLEPIDIANLVLFLASDEARYINGTIIPADMGWRAA